MGLSTPPETDQPKPSNLNHLTWFDRVTRTNMLRAKRVGQFDVFCPALPFSIQISSSTRNTAVAARRGCMTKGDCSKPIVLLRRKRSSESCVSFQDPLKRLLSRVSNAVSFFLLDAFEGVRKCKNEDEEVAEVKKKTAYETKLHIYLQFPSGKSCFSKLN
ncbi:hypothetical protein MTR_5g014980 [Medicago truncatula]|uniref:Uncharacterized protein n=1 Tax=Medicago truncatula TaxID=3880 RepID=G7K164_MEDTR|nr:hypothetical protein MTR_5g014980 [Medicago truncatula]